MSIRVRRMLARGSRVPWLLAVGVAACVSVASAARAADHAGKASFDQYCASCHGTAADGTGPVAEEMKISPADLRKLGQKYGTPLPKPKLREIIDGREMVRAHGTGDMPVWGEQLVHNVPPTVNTTMFKRGTIIVIVDYLETLQVKASE
jgi:mono/diheme cytochrome c family protein